MARQRVRYFSAESGWNDVVLQPFEPDSVVNLSLALESRDHLPVVGWIESNAVPSVHYFAPRVDASERPRPTVQFDPGQTATIRLAPAEHGPAVLELLHRDRPGVALEIRVDGQLVVVVGGTDGWRTERIALPGGEGGETTEGGRPRPYGGRSPSTSATRATSLPALDT